MRASDQTLAQCNRGQNEKTKQKLRTIDSAQVQPKRATVSMPVTSHKHKRKHAANEHRQERNTQYRNTGRKATSKHREEGNN